MTPNIVFGSESWLKPSVSSCEVFPSDYVVYRQDRADGCGGVFIACHSLLTSCMLDTSITSCELVSCQIKLKNNTSLILISVYRPPSSDNHYLNDLCDQLTGIVSSHPNSIFWVAGDINLPDIVWSDHSINGNTYPLNISNIFLNFLDTNGLCQIVSTPTRGTNVLDIFLTNRPSLIETCNVVDGISDHEPVAVKSNLMVKLAPPPTRTLYVWSQADFSMIRHTILDL